MSRDYKPVAENAKNTNKGSPFLTGLLLGFLLGIVASLGVVMLIKGGESPFANQTSNEIAKSVSEKMKEAAKAEEEKANQPQPATIPSENKEETRFDFYTILPGTESKVSKEEEIKIKENAPEQSVQKSYFLQVGAFQTTEEADNMKAKLALQGFEAIVQTATIPDKGIWHRVRVGPLANLDEINQTKSDLFNNGFNADLVKVNIENQ